MEGVIHKAELSYIRIYLSRYTRHFAIVAMLRRIWKKCNNYEQELNHFLNGKYTNFLPDIYVQTEHMKKSEKN